MSIAQAAMRQTHLISTPIASLAAVDEQRRGEEPMDVLKESSLQRNRGHV
jgi:hypothetical protein